MSVSVNMHTSEQVHLEVAMAVVILVLQQMHLNNFWLSCLSYMIRSWNHRISEYLSCKIPLRLPSPSTNPACEVY